MTLAAVLATKNMTEDAFLELSGNEQAKIANDINANNAEYHAEQEKSNATTAELAETTKAIAEETAKQTVLILKTVQVLSERISKMGTIESGEPATIKSLVAEKFEEIKGLEANSNTEVTLKADVSTASITNNTGSFRDDMISPLNVQNITMESLFSHLSLTGNRDNVNKTYTYMDYDDASVVRAAEMIAECAVFPESEIGWTERNIQIRKVGDTIPVCEEFFEDEAMFAGELEFFLRTNVALKVNDQLINGDGTGENLKGLIASSSTYVPVASGIADASVYDLIAMVKCSITALGSKFMPNFVVMNNVDICKMKLKKDSNNNYVLPPFVDRNGQVVDGMLVVEDNGVAANTMIIGDNRFGRIIDRVGLQLSRGYVNDQFKKDQTTLKVRRRLAFLIKESEKAGFAHVTDIAAALVTLAS